MNRILTYCLWIACACLCLVGCRGKVQPDNGAQGQERPRVEVRLSVNMDTGYTVGPAVKSTLQDHPETKITNIAIIARPVVDESTEEGVAESWKGARIFNLPISTLSADAGSYQMSGVVLSLTAGDNIIYILANASHEMTAYLYSGMGNGLRSGRASAYTAAGAPSSVSASSFADSYVNVMEEFASDERGFAMMGKCTTLVGGESTDRVYVDPHKNSDISLSVKLHRLVSKVMLNCETYPETDFVKIKSWHDDMTEKIEEAGGEVLLLDESRESQAGWVPLSSIRYCLNAVNTKVFIEPGPNVSEPKVFSDADPNWQLSDCISVSGSSSSYIPEYGNDFIYLSEEAISDAFPAMVESSPSGWFAQAGKYDIHTSVTDITHITHIDSDTPASGLYCLENMAVNNSDAAYELTEDQRKLFPKMATTHVYVEATYVPRYIVKSIDADGNRVIKSNTTMEDALDCLPEATDPVTGVVYPKGTIFTRDLNLFYSYQGMVDEIARSEEQNAENPELPVIAREEFAVYIAGRCSYTSYIAGSPSNAYETDEEKANAYVTFDDGGVSSVRRDGYYMLTTSIMKVPSIKHVMMEVNTVSRILWQPEGHGQIEIKP